MKTQYFPPLDTYAEKIPLVLILLNTQNYLLNRLCLIRIMNLPGNHENFPTYIRPVQN